MIRNQPHNTYKGRIVILMKTISNRMGLRMQAATRATILKSSDDGLLLHCKCKECGSHYSISGVGHDDVLLLSNPENNQR